MLGCSTTSTTESFCSRNATEARRSTRSRSPVRRVTSLPFGRTMTCGSGMMLRAGSWSHTYSGSAGLVHRWGSWTTTDVLRGNAWQIHTETSFTHSRSSVSTVRPRWVQPPNQGRAYQGGPTPGRNRPACATLHARFASRLRPPCRASTRCCHWARRDPDRSPMRPICCPVRGRPAGLVSSARTAKACLMSCKRGRWRPGACQRPAFFNSVWNVL